MKKTIIIFCFFWPLVMTLLNIQGFSALFIGETISQILAYLNIILLLIGVLLVVKDIGDLSNTARLWFLYYTFYYCFALLATVFLERDDPILRTIPPVTFFFSFFFVLSIKFYRNLFAYIIGYAFLASSIITIILYIINFDMEILGVYKYKLDRAQGVYGDANSSAIVSIFAYIFFDKFFKPKLKSLKIFKVILIFAIFYSLVITYSTTGLSAFVIIFFLNNLKFLTPKRIPALILVFIAFIMFILNIKSFTKELDLSKHQQDKVENIVNVLTLNIDEVDSSGRGDLLQRLFKGIQENPILGNGVDFTIQNKGHNSYFGVWADAGFFTFVCFCSILVIYFVRAFKLNFNDRLFCLAILFVLSVFLWSLQSILNQGYFMALFVYLGYIIDQRK